MNQLISLSNKYFETAPIKMLKYLSDRFLEVVKPLLVTNKSISSLLSVDGSGDDIYDY